MVAAVLLGVLLLFIAQILFSIEALMCKLLDLLYNMFGVFAGIKTVIYKGSENFLIDVFFSNDVITTVYWGMACIGFALTFAFAIGSVVRKMFDSTGERVKATYGMILTNIFKAILLIILMTAIVSASINATGVLLQQVDDLFNRAEELNDPSTIEFDDTDIADMYRIIDTIANFSLNPAYENRFNVNACFNAIRPEMQKFADLPSQPFNYTYDGYDNSWQYWLLQIFNSADVDYELPLDMYNEAVYNAVYGCMCQIKTNKEFKPLQKYERPYSTMNIGAQLGRTVMVASSFGAAKNNSYNKKASITDNLRRAYYTGQKDIYDLDTVESDFEIGLFEWNHLIAVAAAYFMIKEFAIIIINCISRIFNIILLYLTAPGFIAVMPLDDGGKFKQWTTAFVIQSLSIFGSIIATRLMLIFIPIVLSPELVIFDSSFSNIISKLVLIIGICFTAEKASGMISGILADNAGFQSIHAGDVGGGLISSGMAIGGRVLGAVAGKGLAIGKGITQGISDITGLTTKEQNFSKGLKNFGQSLREKGGIFKAAAAGFKTEAQEKEEAEKQEKKDQAQFRKDVTSMLGTLANNGVPNNSAQQPTQQKSSTPPPAPKPAPKPPVQPQVGTNNQNPNPNPPIQNHQQPASFPPDDGTYIEMQDLSHLSEKE